VDLLRDARDEREENVTVTISATDPANPFGVLIPWPMSAQADSRGATRTAGARVVIVNGRAAAWISRGDRQLVVCLPDDEPERSRIGRAMARELVAIAHRAPEGRRGWLIEEINAHPAIDDPSSHFLIEAGFAATAMGLQLRVPRRPLRLKSEEAEEEDDA
jgi:ATP-dependent Lhr-like helicase